MNFMLFMLFFNPDYSPEIVYPKLVINPIIIKVTSDEHDFICGCNNLLTDDPDLEYEDI